MRFLGIHVGLAVRSRWKAARTEPTSLQEWPSNRRMIREFTLRLSGLCLRGCGTGLGLMGVGFAVARFGLFLREMQAGQSHAPMQSSGVSVWSGVALVALGVIVNVSSALRHVQLVRQLGAGTWQPGKVSAGAVGLAAVLATIGVGMAAYLVLMR